MRCVSCQTPSLCQLIIEYKVTHLGNFFCLLRVGDEVKLNIDQSRRRSIMSNYTGTLVLNNPLRQVVGMVAAKRGSLVTLAPGKMRFNFTNKAAMSSEQVNVPNVLQTKLSVGTKKCTQRNRL